MVNLPQGKKFTPLWAAPQRGHLWPFVLKACVPGRAGYRAMASHAIRAEARTLTENAKKAPKAWVAGMLLVEP